VDKDALGPLVALAMLVVAGYGGGFGTLAALAADYFGTRHVGLIYGLLMTACGLGGVVGPLLLAIVRDSSGGYGPALAVLGLGALLGAGLAVALHPPAQAAAGAPASRAAPSGASRQRA
jgi:OFA family oxalate/formate antiporter-like MFS transporter